MFPEIDYDSWNEIFEIHVTATAAASRPAPR